MKICNLRNGNTLMICKIEIEDCRFLSSDISNHSHVIQHPCELGGKQEDTSDLYVIQRTNHKQDAVKTLTPESFNQQQVSHVNSDAKDPSLLL